MIEFLVNCYVNVIVVIVIVIVVIVVDTSVGCKPQ